jgi:hypothetical protein
VSCGEVACACESWNLAGVGKEWTYAMVRDLSTALVGVLAPTRYAVTQLSTMGMGICTNYSYDALYHALGEREDLGLQSSRLLMDLLGRIRTMIAIQWDTRPQDTANARLRVTEGYGKLSHSPVLGKTAELDGKAATLSPKGLARTHLPAPFELDTLPHG